MVGGSQNWIFRYLLPLVFTARLLTSYSFIGVVLSYLCAYG